MDQIGFLNLGEYIGDPRQVSSSATSYPDLDALRNIYFEKYASNYDITDYIRLIKYFDNSLFKMIQDFVPARSGLAAGIVIKQHLLERSKYPVPQLDTYTTTSFAGSGSGNITWNVPFTSQDITITGSIEMVYITGSTGGTFNQFNGLTNEWQVTQSWTGVDVGPLGDVAFTQSNQEEFYNGELSGSEFVVENGELNEANPVKQVETTPLLYQSTGSNSTNPGVGQFFWKYGNHIAGNVFSTAVGIQYLYINEIDDNGVNILTALQNLNPGDSITFTINYETGTPS